MSHSPNFVKQLREVELEAAESFFSKGCRVLELGAGAGWQAKMLTEKGYDVLALEFANPGFSGLREISVFPIQDYDGVNIPSPDASFDVVFSSNVLEHVEHEHLLQNEIHRVLKPSGTAFHIVPSPFWRAWSWVTHYLFVAQNLTTRLRKPNPHTSGSHTSSPQLENSTPHMSKSFMQKLKFFAIPERHGESGNVLSEAWYFSNFRWKKTFKSAGFTVENIHSIPLFYTGYGILSQKLGIPLRRRLAKVLGHATTLYVVKKQP